MAAPDAAQFVLRANVPLPRLMHLRSENISPFKIRSSTGQIFDTQVEVVSYYPLLSDGADVVEILSKIHLPKGVIHGDRVVLDVILGENVTRPHQISEAVSTLISEPGSLTIRARDVFGHKYRADLLRDVRNNGSGELRVMRDGQFARQVRTHENLEPATPATGSTGTLPHLMGIHSYVTTWANEDFISLDLRVHNGHDGLDKKDDGDDPMGKVYFSELEIVVPRGWELLQNYPTPSTGDRYAENDHEVFPIVAPIKSGELHVMVPQAQFHRRFVLMRDGARRRAESVLREESLAFCTPGKNTDGREFFSWWNAGTSRYWAQNLPLPNLSYLETPAESRVEVRSEFLDIHSALKSGNPGPWPINYGAMGWAHPWGIKTGSMQGGSEIFYCDGIKAAWGASHLGYRSFQMSHRMYTERHKTALYNLSGDSYKLEDWIVEGVDGDYLPTWIFMVPWLFLGDPFGFTTAPTFQVDAVANQGRQPGYEAELSQFEWIDAQHLTRYTRSAKVLAWLGNDAIAKDDLRLQAELCRATYSKLPQNELGFGIATGQYVDRKYVVSNPHDGFVVDRGEGWILDTVASAYALADPAWRARVRPWFKDVIQVMLAGQSNCSGTIMSKPNLAHFDGQYRFVQSISECIIQNGLWGVRESVFATADDSLTDEINIILRKSTGAMISENIWNEQEDAPHFYTALGPYDQALASFCGWVPSDGIESYDNYQTWNMFVFGFLLTEDDRFILKARLMAGGELSAESIGQGNHPGELETRAGMISFLQSDLFQLGDFRKAQTGAGSPQVESTPGH